MTESQYLSSMEKIKVRYIEWIIYEEKMFISVVFLLSSNLNMLFLALSDVIHWHHVLLDELGRGDHLFSVAGHRSHLVQIHE